MGESRIESTSIVDLNEDPSMAAHLCAEKVYRWDGKLWRWRSDGCLFCYEQYERSFTLEETDGDELRCIFHGALFKVPYRRRASYRLELGELTREGQSEEGFSFLIPVEARKEEVSALLEECITTWDDFEERSTGYLGPRPESKER